MTMQGCDVTEQSCIIPVKIGACYKQKTTESKRLVCKCGGWGGGGAGVVEDEGSDFAPGRGTEADFCLFRSPLASGMKS